MTYETAALQMPVLGTTQFGLPAFWSGSGEESQLLDARTCAELRRRGWVVEASRKACTLRKSTEGYAAKEFVVTVRRVGKSAVEACGELVLHALPCARTAPVRAEQARLVEQLWPLLEATETLNVFSDDDDEL
jgi:hypothetical protein